MHSKTEEPCDCGTVSAMLNEPETGLAWDDKYGFVLTVASGAMWMVYHCPFCGGLLPDTSHPVWYPQLTTEERSRLGQLIEGISTAEEAIERLGPPDYDAWITHYDSIDGGNPLIVSEHDIINDSTFVYNENLSRKCRNVEYYNLSEHANIEFYFDIDRGVRSEIRLKWLSPRHVVSD